MGILRRKSCARGATRTAGRGRATAFIPFPKSLAHERQTCRPGKSRSPRRGAHAGFPRPLAPGRYRPPFARSALLLDIDGTLLDFAPTPESVVVPPGLLDSLNRIKAALGGALGVISGREIAQVDRLLGDAPHAVAGEHGGAIRHLPGGPIERPVLPVAPRTWLLRMQVREGGARLPASAEEGARLPDSARGRRTIRGATGAWRTVRHRVHVR